MLFPLLIIVPINIILDEKNVFLFAVIGESDLLYTETLLGIGRNEFKDKTILILGGGDGGTLHELLKQSPAYVLMAEVSFAIPKTILSCCRNVHK